MMGKMLGKVAGGVAKVSPFGALGIGQSLFGKKKSKAPATVVEPFNARGSYTDKSGNVIVPAEVVAAQSAIGVKPTSLFAKTGK
jgi:hypothetical protein